MTLFSAYSGFFASLPERAEYERKHLLVPKLLVESDDRFRIYYSPFDWFNPSARVIILGITPGWTQMELACRAARKAILLGKTPNEVCREAKMHGSFAGTMRGNLVEMLDGIGLQQALHLKSSCDLFKRPAACYTPLRRFAILSSRETTTTPATVHGSPSRLS